MSESKKVKYPEGKKAIMRKDGKKTITRIKSKKEVKFDKILFLQGNKPAIIFDEAGKRVLARADKKVFVADTKKMALLLLNKGYAEVE